MQVFGNFDGVDNPLMDFKTKPTKDRASGSSSKFWWNRYLLMTSKLKANELNGANGSTIIPIGLGISLIMSQNGVA